MAMSKRCLRISARGLRAITKLCREVSFYELKSVEPENDYERLYRENKVSEQEVMTLHCLFTQNPSEKVFADNLLQAQGDAICMGMTHELEELGVIGSETDDYGKIPSTIMACHVVVDSLKYKILQCQLMSYLEGYPLQFSFSLQLDENVQSTIVKADDAYEG